MEYNQINAEIEQGIFKPVYFLHGENTYQIDKIANKLLISVLEEHERDFNQTIFYGKDASVESILDSAKRYPLMASYQLIVVREAQHLSRTIEYFSPYFEKPVPTTILVFCFKGKKLDKRKAVSKILSKEKYLFDADPVRDYQLPDWVLKCAQNLELKMDQKSAVLLAEYAGNDLSGIEQSLEKLKILKPKDNFINVELIQKHIGFSKDFNLFELTDSLASFNIKKASFIAQHFGRNNKTHPVVVVIGHLYGFFTKLMKYHFYARDLSPNQIAAKIGVHPFFIKQYQQASTYYSKGKLARILSELRYYDLASKGVYSNTISDEELLKELVFKVMH